ncbi:MAG: MFS transporter [bacterium]|nr:MFS transporter [bacterium]
MAQVFGSFSSRTRFSPDIIALYSQRMIQGAGISLFGIFLPIFLFEKLSFSLESVMVYYAITWAAYLFAVQPGARFMSKVGLKRSMIISSPFLVLFYIALYNVTTEDPWPWLGVSIAAATLWRMTYWVPYHTEFAQFTDRANRGRQIGVLASIAALIGVATPIVAGFVIDSFGYQSLLVSAIILIVVSIFPLFLTRDVREKYSFGYWRTFALLFTKHRRILLAYGAEGAEVAIGLVIWPLFMYQIFEGNYFEIGAVSTLVIFATIVIRLLVGSYTDKFSKRRLLHWGTVIYALGWIGKAFVQTGFQIFLANTYHNLAQAVMRTPFDALTYEQMADSGHYVDEMSVFREISLNIGKVAMYILLFVLVGLVSLNTTFWVAAFVALFINVL